MITILFAVVIGVVAGYAICAFATWNRVHRQESQIRWLSTQIQIQMDMDDEVPPEWVKNQLDSMVQKEFR